MTTGKLGFAGQTPKALVQRAKPNPEKVKYIEMWKRSEYRELAPGENLAPYFIALAKPRADSEVIDFGAGTGRGALMLAYLGKMVVTMLDFVPEALDEDVANACRTQPDRIKFMEHDLTVPLGFAKSYGYCTDVMEHIPEDLVDIVLLNITTAAERVFFAISLQHDKCGELIDEELHVTVKPFEWWLAKFKDMDSVIYFANKSTDGGTAFFYISSWREAREMYKHGTVNTTEALVVQHVKTNIARGFKQCEPHMKHDAEVMILAGGPSLSDFETEIRAKRDKGMALVCTNGTYNWCLDRGIKPSAAVLVDARPFNARFITRIVPGCKYLIASQCHPSVFDDLPPEQVYIWHASLSDPVEEVLNAQYGAWWFPVPGGSTVTLRTFTLLRLLGWWRYHVYGFDSCFMDDKHHAYPQVENDSDIRVIADVSVPFCNRTFRCAPWMATQAQEFVDQVRMFGDEVLIGVYGDGLIANIINSAATGE